MSSPQFRAPISLVNNETNKRPSSLEDYYHKDPAHSPRYFSVSFRDATVGALARCFIMYESSLLSCPLRPTSFPRDAKEPIAVLHGNNPKQIDSCNMHSPGHRNSA